MFIFDKLQNVFIWSIYIFPKNSEINHGGSYHINEAPHKFILNFGESLTWSQNSQFVYSILNSKTYYFA